MKTMPLELFSRSRDSVGHSPMCVSLASLGLLTLGMLTGLAQPRLDAKLGPEVVYRGNWPSSPNYAYDVKIAGSYAYVALLHGGLAVIDVSDPTHCVRVGGYADSRNYYAHNVAIAGNYAYVLDVDNGLEVIDVSNPTNCALVGRYAGIYSTAYGQNVVVTGRYAYLALWPDGLPENTTTLQIIDVSNPTNCLFVGCYGKWLPYGLAVDGHYAYVTDSATGLHVIDVSDPTNCVQVGVWTNAPSGQARGLAVVGNYAYLGDGNAGLRVIDVSNPTNCVQVGSYNNGHFIGAVTVSGNYAFVSDINAGETAIDVIDVSNPTNCVHVGGYFKNLSVIGMTVSENRIYVASYDAGLQVLDCLPNAQFTVQVNALTNVPLALESATNLTDPVQWTPILTTNVATMPFNFVDPDAMTGNHPQKFYRVHQP